MGWMDWQAFGASAVGVNCCSGPDQLVNITERKKALTDLPVIVKPNAGMPVIDASGNAQYNMGPLEFAGHMKKLIEAGADIIGGCCGTTPEYIRKCKEMLDGKLVVR